MGLLRSLLRALVASFCLLVMLISGLQGVFGICQVAFGEPQDAYGVVFLSVLAFVLATIGLLLSSHAEKQERTQRGKKKDVL